MYIRKLLLPLLTTTLMFANVYSAIATESGLSPEELAQITFEDPIKNGDLKTIKTLLKQDKMAIENINIGLDLAAQYAQPKILTYLLEVKRKKLDALTTGAELETALIEAQKDLDPLSKIITEKRDTHDETSKDYKRYEKTLKVIQNEYTQLEKMIKNNRIKQQRESLYK